MPVINDTVDEILKKDLTSGGFTSRNPLKTEALRKQYALIKDYFSEQAGVNVDLLLDIGFNSSGDIFLTGNNITIDNPDVLRTICDGTAYINVFIKDGVMQFQIAHTDLTKEEKQYERFLSVDRVDNIELVDLINQWKSERLGEVVESGDDYVVFNESFTIRHDSLFWYMACGVEGMNISKLEEGRIVISFNQGL